MNIGKNIRELRKEKTYDAIGVNQPTYSKIENNNYKMDIDTQKILTK